MTGLYARLAATAKRVIALYGLSATLVTTHPTTGVTTTRTGCAVRVDRVRHLLGESGVDIGDDRLILDADSAPVVTDRITFGGSSFIVMQVEPIQPGSTVVAWWAWVRAG